ncbi:preprotein translocase subunit SecE [Corynebacterium rouxii]|uniref:Protein translocase subunit SecE n=1 Tax=Corynebacterium rouxii TaxID=2719119 RepID=A0A6I8MG50_9CORY|nr:preprotein translocase subunit SecE [Corynebacterium rouxii]MDT9408132.1 preprotein translocase subunit SecE [Corynebacterium rouxii]MDT9410313.1 preprotein translocase subunit SecE [Corynebacterium rouxii]VZH84422.1 preprotein translocase subunit SecE [Corynebacterium rouxii]
MSDQQPRPTGKRQLAGVSTTSTASYEAKKVAPTGGDDERKGNKVVSFVPEVASEMKKVIWPTAQQMMSYTLIVFAFLILVTALVSGIDFLAGLGVEKVLTK